MPPNYTSASQATSNQQVGVQGTGAIGTGSGGQTAEGSGASTESGQGSIQSGAGGASIAANGSNVHDINITTDDVNALNALENTSSNALAVGGTLGLAALQSNQNIAAGAITENTLLANESLQGMHDTAGLAIDAVTHNADTNAQLATEVINASEQTSTQALAGNESLQNQLTGFESQILAAGAPQTAAYATEAASGTTPLTASSSLFSGTNLTTLIAVAGLVITAWYYFEKKGS